MVRRGIPEGERGTRPWFSQVTPGAPNTYGRLFLS